MQPLCISAMEVNLMMGETFPSELKKLSQFAV
jgi:hypothetical protein